MPRPAVRRPERHLGWNFSTRPALSLEQCVREQVLLDKRRRSRGFVGRAGEKALDRMLLALHDGGFVTLSPEPPVTHAGQYGWSGGYGTTWFNDPHEDLTAIAMTQVSDFLWSGALAEFRQAVYS